MNRPARRRRPTLAASLAVLGAGASYGVVTPLVQAAVRHGAVVAQLTTAQYVLPLLLLWGGVYCRRPAGRLNAADRRLLIQIGVAAGLTTLGYYQALLRLPGPVAVVLLFQFSWMAMAIEAWATRSLPRPLVLGAVMLVLAGTVLAAGVGQRPAAGAAAGWLLALASAFGYALMLFWSGRLDPGLPSTLRAAWSTTAAALAVALCYALADPGLPPLPNRASSWAVASLNGVFSQALPMWLLAAGAPRVGGTLTGILASAELPVAVGLSAWWLGQPVGPWQWLGVCLILVGIALGQQQAAPP